MTRCKYESGLWRFIQDPSAVTKMSLLSLSIRSSGTDRETWSRNSVTWSTTCCFQLSCYAYVPTCTSTTWDVTKRPKPYHRNTRNFDTAVESVYADLKRVTLCFLQPRAVVIRASLPSEAFSTDQRYLYMCIMEHGGCVCRCFASRVLYIPALLYSANVSARLFLITSHCYMLQKAFSICVLYTCWTTFPIEISCIPDAILKLKHLPKRRRSLAGRDIQVSASLHTVIWYGQDWWLLIFNF